MLKKIKYKVKHKIPYIPLKFYYKIRLKKKYTKLIYKKYEELHTLKYNEDNNCIFIHVPKTAGSSIIYSLFNYYPHLHFSANEFKALYGKAFYNNAFKFAFVRNPWDRVFSAYSHALNKNDINLDISNNPFNNFVEYFLLKKKLYLTHFMFFPQTLFLYDKKKIQVDFLGQFENIEADFDFLKKKFNINSKLIHINKSTNISYKDIYNERSKQIIYDIYKDDIKFLNYKF